jgi:hypothetical protein
MTSMVTLMDIPNTMLLLLKHHTPIVSPFQLQTQMPCPLLHRHPARRSTPVKWSFIVETALHILRTMVNRVQSTGRIRRRPIQQYRDTVKQSRRTLGTTGRSDGALTALRVLRYDRHDALGSATWLVKGCVTFTRTGHIVGQLLTVSPSTLRGASQKLGSRGSGWHRHASLVARRKSSVSQDTRSVISARSRNEFAEGMYLSSLHRTPPLLTRPPCIDLAGPSYHSHGRYHSMTNTDERQWSQSSRHQQCIRRDVPFHFRTVV